MVFATCMQAYALQDANLTHCAEIVNSPEMTEKKKKKNKKVARERSLGAKTEEENRKPTWP